MCGRAVNTSNSKSTSPGYKPRPSCFLLRQGTLLYFVSDFSLFTQGYWVCKDGHLGLWLVCAFTVIPKNLSIKKRTRFFCLMLQGKSIIPPATQAIKMLIKTFLFDTSCAHFPPQYHVPIFSVPLFLPYCHWFSEFEKMDDGIVEP